MEVSILCHLGNGTLRTGELKRLMPNISQRVLTLQLRELKMRALSPALYITKSLRV